MAKSRNQLLEDMRAIYADPVMEPRSSGETVMQDAFRKDPQKFAERLQKLEEAEANKVGRLKEEVVEEMGTEKAVGVLEGMVKEWERC